MKLLIVLISSLFFNTLFAQKGGWKEYPDVPYVSILKDIDGIEVKRMPLTSLPASAAVAAKGAESPPNASRLTLPQEISFSVSEVPNNLLAGSHMKVGQIIMSQVYERLVKLDRITNRPLPSLAKGWVILDGIRLKSKAAGYERKLALDGNPAAEQVRINMEKGVSLLEYPTRLRVLKLDGASSPYAWVRAKRVDETAKELKNDIFLHH